MCSRPRLWLANALLLLVGVPFLFPALICLALGLILHLVYR